jgi:hypothetical protein
VNRGIAYGLTFTAKNSTTEVFYILMSEKQVLIWNIYLMVSIYEVPKAEGGSFMEI